MNRIKKKAILELEQMNPEIVGDALKKMLGILKGDTHEYFGQFLLLQLVFDSLSFTEEEKGYIYYSFLESNYEALNHPIYRYNNEVYYQLIKDSVLSNAINKDIYYFLNANNPKRLHEIKETLVMERDQKFMEYIHQELAIYQRFFQAFSKNDAVAELKEVMDEMDLPIGVQESLLIYYHQLYKERVFVKSSPVSKPSKVNTLLEEPKISKKELKMQLKEYYDEQDEMKPFDFIHYEQVVSILKELNYSEKHITQIISVLLRNHVDNYSYFVYIFQKYAARFPNNHLLEEVKEAWQSMVILESDEDYDFYKNYILENISLMEQDLFGNFDYDLQRVYSKK